MPLVKQELLTRPEQLSSPPFFKELDAARSLVFCAVFCMIIVCLFVLLLLAIVLPSVLPFTASYYPFGMFKPFLTNLAERSYI